MAELALKGGLITLIDDQDIDAVSHIEWRAWYNNGKFYAISCGRKSILLHRYLLAAPRGLLVDHKSGDTLDNRRSNIRLCSSQQNNRNRTATSSRHGFKGIYLPKGRTRYQAAIKIDGRAKWLGSFATAIEGALAYDNAAKHFFGEFARLNFPEGLSSFHDIPMMLSSDENGERDEGQQFCPKRQSGVFK